MVRRKDRGHGGDEWGDGKKEGAGYGKEGEEVVGRRGADGTRGKKGQRM